jgi:WD40 repeat protein
MALSPDARFLTTPITDGTSLEVHYLLSGRKVSRSDLAGVAAGATAFSPDGEFLAVFDRGGEARLWEVGRWKPVDWLPGSTPGVTCLAFSPAENRLAVADDDGRVVHIWDLVVRRLVFSLPRSDERMRKLRFSSDGRSLLGLSSRARLSVWQAPSLVELGAAGLQ